MEYQIIGLEGGCTNQQPTTFLFALEWRRSAGDSAPTTVSSTLSPDTKFLDLQHPSAEGSDFFPEEAEPTGVGTPAWLLSTVLHLTLFLAAAFLLEASTPPAIEADRPTGIALVQRSAEQTVYYSEAATSSSQTRDAASSFSLPTIEAVTAAAEMQLPTLSELPGLGHETSQVQQAEAMLTGTGRSRQFAGGQASTQVFGTRGTGSRFIYVFDRSESMQGFEGRPLAAAKSELLGSLRDLRSVHQFQIIFYNEKLSVFNPQHPQPPNILFASDENKKLATRYLDSVHPLGGTRHLAPLETALSMNPDVVFFLTDAADPPLSPGQLARLKRLNRGSSINAIEFGSVPFPGGENFLARLARQNGGQYVYIDVTKLPRRGAAGRARE